MANQLPSFASGSNLAIQIGAVLVAYGTNLSWSDDVAHAAVGGIGSYSYDALEPLQYLARGSFSIVRYGTDAYNNSVGHSPANLTGTPGPAGTAPSRAPNAPAAGIDGNTMLRPNNFNPATMLLSQTFDINVYERQPTATNNGTLASPPGPIFKLSDCRLTSYSITFTPGQLVSENIGFMCILVTDATTQPTPAKG